MRVRALHSSLVILASALVGSLLSAAPALAQPVAFDDSFTTNEDQTLSRNNGNGSTGVRANDDLGGFPNSAVDVDVVTQPSNGALTIGQNGNFIYVPAENFNGTDIFTYQLLYPLLGVSNVATVTIVVNPVNDAPTGVINRSYSTTEGVTLSVPAPGVLAGVNDPDGPVTAAVATNVAPAAGTLSMNPNGSFTFDPAAGFSGNATFTYRAIDDTGGQSAPATVTIAVAGINDPPVANADSYNATEDTVLTVNAATGVLANDTDPDTGTVLNAVVVAAMPVAEGTVTLNLNGSFTFRPALNFSGTTSFTYNARDNATPPTLSETPATVTITVAAVNDAPVAVADVFETTENVPLVVNGPGILGNDTDVDSPTLTAQLVTSVAPTSGTLSPIGTGGFTYTPTPGFSGTATFTYRAVDNGTPPVQSTAAATVTITVRNVNDPPVAVPDTYTATEDTVLTISTRGAGVLGNDTDPDPGTVLTAILVTPPAHGTLTLNPNGSFVYSPALDYQGPDTFRYRARDNGTPPLQSAEATVTINVTSTDDAPRFVTGITAIPAQTATENVPFGPLALAQFFVDPEGSPLTFVVTGLPAGLSATPEGVVGGTPALNVTAGTLTVDVVVSDGPNQFPTTFALVVLAAGRTDVALSGTATPSPAVISQPVAWTFVIENRSPVENVGNLALQVEFLAPASFVVTPGIGCTATPQADRTAVACTAGPVLAGGQTTLTMSGSSAEPGDVVATASVSITDAVPVEAVPENDTATVIVNIAQSIAVGPAQTLSVTGHRASAAGDFDGDGFIDLAVAAEGSGGTLIYPNVADTSTPGSARRVLATQAIPLGDAGLSTDIAAADLNGDGALDLIVAKQPGPSLVLRNPNDRTFAFVASPALAGAPKDNSNAIAARDVDGDGRVDLVLANASPNRIFVNQGGEVFTEFPQGLGNDDSRDSVLANLVGDSGLELVFANANRGATIYVLDAATNRYQEILLSVTGATTSVAAGDFNGDTLVDLVFGRTQSKLVLLNTTSPGGPLQFAPPIALGAAPTTDLIATDIDADGDVDIIGINSSGSHQVFANNGAGQFTVNPQQFASAGARHATAAKLSADDRIDVAVIGTSSLEVFYNDGTGNLGKGDIGSPVIQLVGQPSVELTVESAYTDPGATATDAVDGDLTAKITVDNPVNTAVIGTYTVTYNVVDSSGNAAAAATRTVRVGVRSGTGGGGGGSFDIVALLALAVLALLGTLRPLATRRSVS